MVRSVACMPVEHLFLELLREWLEWELDISSGCLWFTWESILLYLLQPMQRFLLTSSSVALIFVLSGIIPWACAVYFLIVCVLGSMILKPRIDAYAHKSGMMSILIGALVFIIGVSTLGCIYILFTSLARIDWCLDGFWPFCPASLSSSYCAKRLPLKADFFE